MTDEQYNPEHCDGCNADCGLCNDAYKTEGGIKPVKVGRHITRWDYDSEGYCIMRYAQRKCLNDLTRLSLTKELISGAK